MKNILYVLFSNYGTMALGLVVSLYTKQLLGPSFAGAFAIVTVFMYYSNAVNSLFRSAMDREIPMARSSLNSEFEQKILGHIYWSILLINVSFTLFFLWQAIVYWQDIELRYAFLIGSCLANITAITNYLQVYHRVYEQFKLQSIFTMSIQSVLQFLTLLGVIFGHLKGYLLASIISFLFSIVIARKYLFSLIKMTFDKAVIKLIVQSGGLLSIFSFLQLGLFTIDRFFILNFLTRVDLGLYSIGLMVSSIISLLPASFSSSLLMPRWYKLAALNQWKRANYSIITSSIVAIHITGFVIVLAILLIPFIIKTFLSNFLSGILTSQILCISSIWIFMVGPFSILLSAKRQFFQMILCGIVAIICGILLDYYMVFDGIEGIAKATTITLFIFANLIFATSQFTLNLKAEFFNNFVLLNGLGISFFISVATTFQYTHYLLLVYLVYCIFQRKKIFRLLSVYLMNVGGKGYKNLFRSIYKRFKVS